MRVNKLVIVFFLAAAICVPASARIATLVLTDVPAANFNPNDTNKLVLDIGMTDNGTADSLTAIDVANTLTAYSPNDIAAVKLWYKAGGGSFDPGTATLLGTMTPLTSQTWRINGLNQFCQAGDKLFVTIDVASAPANGQNMKFQLVKRQTLFSSGATMPAAVTANGFVQTIVNLAKVYVSYISQMPAKVNPSQANVFAVQYGFRNSGGSAVNITGLKLTPKNYAGSINGNLQYSKITVKDGATTYATLASVPASTPVTVTFGTPFSIPAGGTEVPLYIYLDIAAGINTYDAGIELNQVSDVVNAFTNTIEAYSGYSFPMASSRAIISQPLSSVNAARTDIMPAFVTKGQLNAAPVILTFSHPYSVTTYADCVISGITITSGSVPSQNANQLFSSLYIYNPVTEYARVSTLPASDKIWMPFSQNITLTAGTARSLTLGADVLSSVSATSFYAGLSLSTETAAKEGGSGALLTVNGTFPMFGGPAAIQSAPTGVNVTHTNKMPAYAGRGQQNVYCEDIVFTHPDSGNYAAIEIKGLTITVENELGTGITPDSVLSKILIYDAANNTLVSYSAIPSAGTKVYIDLAAALTIPAGASRTMKVVAAVQASPSESYFKLNVNTNTSIRAADKNSGAATAVSAGPGDAFPMKTTPAQIIDPATEVRVRHGAAMPASVNKGQQGVTAQQVNFYNAAAGIASIAALQLFVHDASGASISADSALSRVVIRDANNTATVYADMAIATNAANFTVPLSLPVNVSPGIANSVTVSVRADIAASASAGSVKIVLKAASGVDARDYTSWNPITVNTNSDTFPMDSGLAFIEKRALTVNAYYNGANAGTALKGDPNIKFMNIILENPGDAFTSDAVITGVTITTEDATGTINAQAVFARIKVENASNTSLVYGQTAIAGVSEKVFIPLSLPVVIPPGEGNCVTLTVAADISSSAPSGWYRLNLKYAEHVSAADANEFVACTINAKAGYSFPDMESNLLNVASSDKLIVSHADKMPAKVSAGQKSVKPIELTFANASDAPVRLNGVTLSVNSGFGPLTPAEVLASVTITDSLGNTKGTQGSPPGAGSTLYVNFSSPLDIPGSSEATVHVFADIKAATFNGYFAMSLAAGTDVDAQPATVNVQADAAHAFPMESSLALIQFGATAGGISHTDVIPTTVSTGQANIFAEILNISNINVTGTADVTLAGLNFTVEDDTNTTIDPSKAIKKILIRDDTTVYAFYTSVPSTAAPFFVPFNTPLSLTVTQSSDIRIYVDIVDTLQSGSFRMNLNINADVQFRDKNTGLTITAQAINGDSFPMKTSTVIIQEKAAACRVSHVDMAPAAANKGQAGVNMLKLTFSNPGSASSANVIITRINLFTENSSDGQLSPPKNAVTKVTVKDASSGSVYGEAGVIPDTGDSVSIGLTTPITVRTDAPSEVIVSCEINPDAGAPGFKLDVKTGSNITARDANSYEIISTEALPGYSFPMRSGYTQIQTVSTSLEAGHQGVIAPTVNKGDENVAAMILSFRNPAPAGYSSLLVTGVTITVENNTGAGINAGDVLSAIVASDNLANTRGAVYSMPASGSLVYVPLTFTAITIAPQAAVNVTLYANVKAVTSELYFQLDLAQAANAAVKDVNSGAAVTGISAKAGDSFPMRSGYTVVLSAAGIKADHIQLAPVSVSGGQDGVPLMSLRMQNIGSFTDNFTGVTVRVLDEWLNQVPDASALFDALYVVESGNTLLAYTSIPAAGSFSLAVAPLSVLPQDSETVYIYADIKDVTFTARVSLSVNAAGDIVVSSPVSALAPDAFPMLAGTRIYAAPSGIAVSYADLMPPTVSTGQDGLQVLALSLRNVDAPGHASAVIYGVTITAKSSGGAPINMDTAINRIIITDYSTEFLSGTVPSSQASYYAAFSVPLTIAAGATADIYILADVTDNIVTTAADFKLGIETQGSIKALDYNAGTAVAVSAETGYSFPMESSAALIQRAATRLDAASTSTMPAFVSTGQANVKAMNIVLSDAGNSLTAGIMITRINFYIQDSGNAVIPPQNVISALRVTSADGSVIHGENTTLAPGKVTINLTSSVLVTAGSPVTICVKADVAGSTLSSSFKVSLDAATDIYAIDANSYNVVPQVAGAFPLKSAAAAIQPCVANVTLSGFTDMSVAAATKGRAGFPLFAFNITNNSPAGAADAVFGALTITVKDSINADISASNALQNMYILDSLGNTIGLSAAGVSNKIGITLSTPVSVAQGLPRRVTLYTDIAGTAIAADFKALIASGADVSVIDKNKAQEAPKTVSPAMPWQTGNISIYDAPATDLRVWHDGISFLPAQVGRGQNNVKLMSFSMYNPGGAGTADVLLKGVSITAYDNAGNTLAPSAVFDFIKMTDLTATYYYGGVTASALGSAGPAYVQALERVEAAASNTTTVYFAAKIASTASLLNFKIVITAASALAVQNDPSGAIAVTAKSPDSFPMDTSYTTVIASTNIINVKHESLMPVSVEKGKTGLRTLAITVENKSGIDIGITGVTLTVKDRNGNALPADRSLVTIRVIDPLGNTAGTAAAGPSGSVIVPLAGFTVTALSEKKFFVLVDVKAGEAEPFSIELASPSHVETDQPASIQASAGDYFGNMRTNAVSIQEASLDKSFHSFPNPFNPEKEKMSIEYYLPEASEVTITIFTLDGRTVKTVIEKADKAAGLHYEDTWNALTGRNAAVMSGVYLCVLEVKGKVSGKTDKLVKKIAVLR